MLGYSMYRLACSLLTALPLIAMAGCSSGTAATVGDSKDTIEGAVDTIHSSIAGIGSSVNAPDAASALTPNTSSIPCASLTVDPSTGRAITANTNATGTLSGNAIAAATVDAPHTRSAATDGGITINAVARRS